ncbi:HEAT repeat domain-containing protein [Aquisphaera insulae]|uniref:HEAT repeat domain-containing protein n=1 Tax=Aquisphaera insulae TaxID=2712864 RepID=UPI0013EDDDF8|nr:HEAT repeat domain-containing protein [Aquisphaera insulae]
MSRWGVGWLGLLCIGTYSPETWAQGIPSIPGTGAGTVPGAVSSLGGAAVAPQRTIWGFLGLTPQNFAACKDKLCSCQFGQMLNSLMTGPMGAVTGGFVSHLCPAAPSPAAIQALENKPNGAAQAAAAKIQASEADAKARVAAVEYLGTVDCNRFPEAKQGLMSALATDPNECVRYAAARALGNGCCCDQDVIEKLRICVAGEKAKGAPAETSARVRAAAFAALQNCLTKVPDEVEGPPATEERASPEDSLPRALPDPKKRAKPESTTSTKADPDAVVTSVRSAKEGPRVKTYEQTVAEARRTLVDMAQHPQPRNTLEPGRKSVLDAFAKARRDIDAKSRQPRPAAAPATSAAPTDNAVMPSSYVPSGTGTNAPAAGDGFPSSSPAKRGLFGLLVRPRNPG